LDQTHVVMIMNPNYLNEVQAAIPPGVSIVIAAESAES
jgi:hypothetical protein